MLFACNLLGIELSIFLTGRYGSAGQPTGNMNSSTEVFISHEVDQNKHIFRHEALSVGVLRSAHEKSPNERLYAVAPVLSTRK